MADIFCFTGHKNLFGPQGTGGIIARSGLDFAFVKTGGMGSNSFEKLQPQTMPDLFEAGTQNAPGLYGLQKGVAFINEIGTAAIHAREMQLMGQFSKGISSIDGVTTYGDLAQEGRLPIVSLNLAGLTSSELAERLWTHYSIATRAGSHCAPLLHKRFGTAERGMVRFSFSYFNTEEEIEQGVYALREIARGLR
jgi:selenocysteine lyase/cysteine desulfurase